MVRDGIMNAVWCNGKRTEKSFNLNYKCINPDSFLTITKSIGLEWMHTEVLKGQASVTMKLNSFSHLWAIKRVIES